MVSRELYQSNHFSTQLKLPSLAAGRQHLRALCGGARVTCVRLCTASRTAQRRAACSPAQRTTLQHAKMLHVSKICS